MIRLSMACGHALTVSDDGATVPVCECGERRVAAVHARAPRFRGICQGPRATFVDLPGMPVTVGVPTHE